MKIARYGSDKCYIYIYKVENSLKKSNFSIPNVLGHDHLQVEEVHCLRLVPLLV